MVEFAPILAAYLQASSALPADLHRIGWFDHSMSLIALMEPS